MAKIENNIDFCKGKTLISTFTGYISPNSKTAWYQDARVLKKIFIEKYGRDEVELLVFNKSKFPEDWIINFQDLGDINDYHEIVIVTSAANVFGGTFPRFQLDFIKKMTEYKGRLFYYFNDINWVPFRVGEYIRRVRTKHGLWQDGQPYNDITEEDLLKFDEMDKRFTVMSTWKNYDAAENRRMVNRLSFNVGLDWFFFDLNQTNVAKENYSEVNVDYIPISERPYDFIFYSVNKKFMKRLQKITKYIDEKDKCLFIGLKNQEDTANIHYKKQMLVSDIMSDEMRKCKFTLVFSCDLANNNIITWRYYECMYANILCFILDEFDPNHEYVKNEELRDFIYVSSPEEYREKVRYCIDHEDFYRKMIQLEYEEITNG